MGKTGATIRICASITEKCAADCIEAVLRAKKEGAKIAELRLDSLENPNEAQEIIRKAKKANIQVIATNRNCKNRGNFKGGEEERIYILNGAINAGCDFVDIELDTEEKLRAHILSLARQKRCKSIVSSHDFEKTPDMKSLSSLLSEQRKIADIGKIVAFGNTHFDTIRIFNLLRISREAKFPLIAFAMGDACIFSRILAPMFGSYMTYACTGGKAAAPGQLSVIDMVNVYNELGVKL